MNLLVKRAGALVGHVFKVYCSGAARHAKMTNSLKELDSKNIVWIDLEMTGLDIEKDKILEVGCIITDGGLNIVAEGPNLIINQPEEVLDNMNEWCKKNHGKSGLISECKNSNMDVEKAEKILLDFVKKYTAEGVSPLAGNSVYMDRLFLMKFMPNLNKYLHYRIIDVSTIKELLRHWNADVYKNKPKKEFTHRGLKDIQETIEELKFYKENFFKIN